MSLKKQRGALSAEAIMYTVFIVIGLIFVAAQAPNIMYKINEARFLSQANEIAQEANAWKKARPNFDGVTITKICEETSLSKNICGDDDDGSATNPFGGDWSVDVNDSKGLFDVTATIPDTKDQERITSLANSVAPSTRAQCYEATDCETVTTDTNSLTMTY
ncbi:hypothetical protein WOB87_23430 [Vibrio parahaemolyticus]|uniref:hypothetical protein n=1 Tax=Vibrio parahaemolyticus TaxID=670 RepID=UPI00111CE0EF|nr:hypothetical protein [Vibrio parahaemolyticus]TOG38880.1 hypothetical protein CGJ02_22785 [Vibrio parahaemolyticus]HAV1390077.1 hypothetical protein [Vibrio parahaemolyticus]HBC3544390.1 hypothetical protein [Vibrio parahaemolyticus]HBN6296739.1 hypothetical protein [Vibrio parahaemolyticus]